MQTIASLGGELVPIRNLKSEVDKCISAQKRLHPPDLYRVMKAASHYEKERKYGLLWRGDTVINSDLICDSCIEWVEDNGIFMLACLGDLKIEGDLIHRDVNWAPLLFVKGNLIVENITSVGLPLIVLGDLLVSGFLVEGYYGGPLRIGGNLQASGYVPRGIDSAEIKAHIIKGRVDAEICDMTHRPGKREYRLKFVKSVLDSDGFPDLDKIRSVAKNGESIFRDPEDAKLEPPPPVPPPMPATNSVNPLSLGTIQEGDIAQEELCKLVKETFERDGSKYPASFSEFIEYQLEEEPEHKVLVLPPGTHINGDLLLDWRIDWVEKGGIYAVATVGDLYVDGDILNRTLEGGPMLFVGGNLKVNNLIKAGAPVIVLGNVEASGIVVGEYNDGVMRIKGDLTAQGFFLLDHDASVNGKVSAVVLNEWDGFDWWEQVFPELFDSEDESSPNVDLLWAQQRAGRPILKPDAPPVESD